MDNYLENVRFSVIKNKGVIELSGVFHEGVECRILDDLVKNEEVLKFDFSRLKYASWLALNKFHAYISQMNKKTRLMNIPFHIYHCLKLIKDFDQNIEIEKFEVKFIKFSDDGIQIVQKYVGDEDYKQIYGDDTDIASLKGDVFLGLRTNILPHNMDNQKIFGDKLSLLGDNDKMFFLNYMLFTLTTLILARDVVHSVNLALHLILNQLIASFKDFENALKVLSHDLDKDDLNSIIGLRDRLDHIIVNKFEVINHTLNEYEGKLAAFQKSIIDKPEIAQDEIHKFLRETNSILQQSHKSTEQLESSGSEVGKVIFSNSILKSIEEKFMTIEEKDVDSQLLEAVRKELNIMNPLSEDSWEDTLEDIKEEIEIGNEQVAQCSTILQGFDLTRQIIEHRLSEHELIEAYDLAKNSNSLVELKNTLGKMINGKLVTEQEKFSLLYFLPGLHEQQKKENSDADATSLSPGNVVLF